MTSTPVTVSPVSPAPDCGPGWFSRAMINADTSYALGYYQLMPVYTTSGVPVNSTTLATVAAAGSLLVDTNAKVLYQNTGTLAVPVWTSFTANSGSGTYTGTFDGLVGSGTPAAGVFTTIAGTTFTGSGLATVASLKVDTGTKTATASTGAATLNKSSGIVTTEALSTAAGSDYTLILTNSTVAAGDVALVSVDSNSSTGLPMVYSVKTTSSTITVIIRNVHASVAFNAALKIAFVVFKA